MRERLAPMETQRDTLLGYFSKLNEEGRAKTLVYMRDLAGIKKYTTREKREPAQVIAFGKRR